jgi:hypothetical protein
MKMNIRLLIFSFGDAMQSKKKVILTFLTQDNQTLIRKCAPLDIAPSRRAKIKFYKYHFWDYDSTKPHVLSLDPGQIVDMQILAETFNPEEIVTWDTSQSPWCLKRDWGRLS